MKIHYFLWISVIVRYFHIVAKYSGPQPDAGGVILGPSDMQINIYIQIYTHACTYRGCIYFDSDLYMIYSLLKVIPMYLLLCLFC